MKRTEPSPPAHSPSPKRARIGDTSAWFNTSALADVVLHVTSDVDPTSRTTLHAHRVILASASAYFAKLFTSGFAETVAREIEITADPVLFTAMVRWIYTQETIPSWDTRIRLWYMADRFGALSVCKYVEREISAMPHPPVEDIVRMLVMMDGDVRCAAMRKSLGSMLTLSLTQTTGFHYPLLEDSLFLGLPLVAVRAFLSCDVLIVCTEDEVLAAATFWWVKNGHDSPTIWQDLVRATVRWPFMTTSALITLLAVPMATTALVKEIQYGLAFRRAICGAYLPHIQLEDMARDHNIHPRAYRGYTERVIELGVDTTTLHAFQPEFYINGNWVRFIVHPEVGPDGHIVAVDMQAKRHPRFWDALLASDMREFADLHIECEEDNDEDSVGSGSVSDVLCWHGAFFPDIKADVDDGMTVQLTITLSKSEAAIFKRIADTMEP